tara:strand:+ start:317 stop:1252 length:936 start_codon:yes stop_codon:yes gene_type:complete
MKTAYDEFYPDYLQECDFYEIFDLKKLDKHISKNVVIALRHLTSWLYFDDEGNLSYERFLKLENSEDEIHKTTYEQLKERLIGIKKVLKEADSKIWIKAEKLFSDYPEQGQVWLITAIYNSFLWMGICGPKVITQSKFIEWKEELSKHLEKAAEMIYQMPPNAYGWERIIRKETAALINNSTYTNARKISGSEITSGTPLAYELLKVINSSLQKTENDSFFFRKQINKSTAPRDYFMRSLTCAFLQETGKPYRSIVTEVTSAAFNCSLSVPEVVRATRDIDPEKSSIVVCDLKKKILKTAGVYPNFQSDAW